MVAIGIPFILAFILFYIVPFALSFYYSAIESAFSKRFVGLQNYASVIGNKYFRLALMNTFEFVLTGVPVLTVLSLALSVMLHSLGGRYPLIRGAFILPMLLPTASVVPIFRLLFADGFIRLPVYLLYYWKNAGFGIILLMAAQMMIPGDIYEAAALDGARGFRRFFSITLPLIAPTLFFTSVLAIVQALRIFKEVYLLYGAYPDPSIYLVQHYMNNHFFKLNYQNLTAGAIMFALIVYAIVAAFYRFERRIDVAL